MIDYYTAQAGQEAKYQTVGNKCFGADGQPGKQVKVWNYDVFYKIPEKSYSGVIYFLLHSVTQAVQLLAGGRLKAVSIAAKASAA